MRVRNYLSLPSSQRDEAEEEEEDSRSPRRSSSPAPPTEHDELLVDLRNFVAFQASADGQATTQEVLGYFKPRLSQQQAPVFRELLRSICDFHRTSGQEGIWRLKEHFRWVKDWNVFISSTNCLKQSTWILDCVKLNLTIINLMLTSDMSSLGKTDIVRSPFYCVVV